MMRMLPFLIAAILAAVGCGSAPADGYRQCEKCSVDCKGPDGCPRSGECAMCPSCSNRATQCANCAKRVSTLKPCDKAPGCHVSCKGCQFQGREGCDRTLCDCGKK